MSHPDLSRHPEILLHHQAMLASLAACRHPAYLPADLVGRMAGAGLTWSAADPVAAMTQRMAQRARIENQYGTLVRLAGLLPAGQGPGLDGLYLSGDESMAWWSLGGIAIGFARHQATVSPVQLHRGVLLDRGWKGAVEWRRDQGLDANTRSRRIAASIRAALPDEPQVVLGALQFVHEKFLAVTGETAIHPDGHLTTVGERHQREATLFALVGRIFPGAELHRGVHLREMERLELDIHLPGRRLAFEHQGQQHDRPVAHFGGEAAFAALQLRDARKRELCRDLGITLIEVRHDEPLDLAHLHRRLADAGITP